MIFFHPSIINTSLCIYNTAMDRKSEHINKAQEAKNRSIKEAIERYHLTKCRKDFVVFVKLARQTLILHAYGVLEDKVYAEEAAHNVMMRMCKPPKNGYHNMGGFLYKAAYNEACSLRRRYYEKDINNLKSFDDEAYRLGVGADFFVNPVKITAHQYEKLYDYFTEFMNVKQAQALKLCAGGYSYKQIQQFTNTPSLDTVKSQIADGRKALKKNKITKEVIKRVLNSIV